MINDFKGTRVHVHVSADRTAINYTCGQKINKDGLMYQAHALDTYYFSIEI